MGEEKRRKKRIVPKSTASIFSFPPSFPDVFQ